MDSDIYKQPRLDDPFGATTPGAGTSSAFQFDDDNNDFGDDDDLAFNQTSFDRFNVIFLQKNNNNYGSNFHIIDNERI